MATKSMNLRKKKLIRFELFINIERVYNIALLFQIVDILRMYSEVRLRVYREDSKSRTKGKFLTFYQALL